ncbi:MAG: response regulator, partial [Proteobacteria bacterium]|nr:response regulator [Pseudomonadota bacterium]
GLLDIAPEAVISIDVTGRIQLFNQGAEAIFGYRGKEIMGQPLEVLLPPRVRAHHAEFIAGFARAPEASRRMGRRREIAALHKDGTEFPAAGSISKLGAGEEMLFTVVLRDLTEQRRVEESERQLRSQLAHAGRLSAVGNMATGLAHEINQPLAAIGGYVQASIRLLRSGKDSTGEVIADLEKANRQVMRAADIVKWLRGIVAKEETKKIELDLNACIQEITDFLEFEFRTRKCTLVVDLAESLPAVMADKVQIQQVILNLLQNGMEAAEQSARRGCQLTVRTSASTDGTVQVEVEDSGPGIPPEIRGDLFSPFVTTKRDGLGFGLSISKSIVEAHGGRIWAVSDAGNGATFAFTLPSAGADAKAPQDTTVFVVDDDEALRDSLHQLFRSAGFEVRTFGSGEEFLAGYEPGRMGCLVADVRMPGMSGFDLKKEMTARAIDLPVIMITGDGDAAVERRAGKAGVVAFFHKPVTDEVLLGAVEKAIAGGPVPSD